MGMSSMSSFEGSQPASHGVQRTEAEFPSTGTSSTQGTQTHFPPVLLEASVEFDSLGSIRWKGRDPPVTDYFSVFVLFPGPVGRTLSYNKALSSL